MASNGKPQFVKNIFLQQSKGGLAEAVDASVRQDKDRISSDRPATPRPASVNHGDRSPGTNSHGTRTHSPLVHKSRTAHLNVWINPIDKAKLERLAKQEGLSLSATTAAFLERSLQEQVDLQYSALLEPIIISAIRKELKGTANRLTFLLARNAFTSEQTRNLVTNILGRQQGMTEESLKTILDMTKRTAQGSLTRRNPELEELIQALKEWLAEQEESN